MGNYSRPPQPELAAALASGYCNVRFQQGKPILDRELNLSADLASPRRLAADHIGSGLPAGSDGFRIDNVKLASGDFTISAGSCLVNGITATLAADTSYRSQPVKTNIAPLPPGTSFVYLHVTTIEATALDDPGLTNAADVRFETSVRERVVWEVLVATIVIAAADHLLLAVLNTGALPVQTDRRRANLTLASVRDDLDSARGSATSLTQRLQQSLAADGTLVPGAVTQNKMAAGSVALAQLKQANVFTGSVTVAPASENSIAFFQGSRQAMIFTSLLITAGTGFVTWREFATFVVIGAVTTINRGLRVKNENALGGATITVAIQAIEVAPA